MSNRYHKRLKVVSFVILITLMSKISGLGRGILMAQTFGTSLEVTNSYDISVES